MLQFLVQLLTAPVELSYVQLSEAVAVLLVCAWVIALVVAITHSQLAASWKKLLVTRTRIKVSWAWGWCCAGLLLSIYAAQLAYRMRIPSLFAGLPFVIAAGVCVLIGYWLRRDVQRELKDFQKLISRR